jgi:hypothetical protein
MLYCFSAYIFFLTEQICKLSFAADDLDTGILSRVHERTISLRFLDIISRVLRFRFTLQTSFKPFFLGGGGGGLNPLVEVTVNS